MVTVRFVGQGRKQVGTRAAVVVLAPRIQLAQNGRRTVRTRSRTCVVIHEGVPHAHIRAQECKQVSGQWLLLCTGGGGHMYVGT